MAVSGPLDDAGTLRYRASFNFYNTDGYLENVNLDRKADPDRDYTARLRLLWKSSDLMTADLRFAYNQVNTTAYYYVIPRAVESNPFSSFTTPPNANDTASPIQTNNEGMDHRFVTDVALKLDFNAGFGTVTSTSDYNETREIDAGDAYDFRPIATSIAYNYFFAGIPAADGGPAGESQSQFIDERTESEELRFTSQRKTASRGSPGPTPSIRPASFPPAICMIEATASRPSTTRRWSTRPIRTQPTPTPPSSPINRRTTRGRHLLI